MNDATNDQARSFPADRVSKGRRMRATALVDLETGSCQCHRTEVESTVPKLDNHINLTNRSNRSVSTGYSTLANMNKQLALLLVGLAITNAVYVNYENPYGDYNNPPLAVPIAISEHPGFYEKDYAYPRYSFNYGVNDPHTGDVKNQEEVREGDVVKGSYSLNEPDGTIRVVEYTADDHNGFNAIVKKIGHSIHPEQIPVVQYSKLVPAHYSHVNYDGY